jgi:hypothetical protein
MTHDLTDIYPKLLAALVALLESGFGLWRYRGSLFGVIVVLAAAVGLGMIWFAEDIPLDQGHPIGAGPESIISFPKFYRSVGWMVLILAIPIILSLG